MTNIRRLTGSAEYGHHRTLPATVYLHTSIHTTHFLWTRAHGKRRHMGMIHLGKAVPGISKQFAFCLYILAIVFLPKGITCYYGCDTWKAFCIWQEIAHVWADFQDVQWYFKKKKVFRKKYSQRLEHCLVLSKSLCSLAHKYLKTLSYRWNSVEDTLS